MSPEEIVAAAQHGEPIADLLEVKVAVDRAFEAALYRALEPFWHPAERAKRARAAEEQRAARERMTPEERDAEDRAFRDLFLKPEPMTPRRPVEPPA